MPKPKKVTKKKTKNVEQECIITIQGIKNSPNVNLQINWKPELDLKDYSKNHPSVVTLVMAITEKVQNLRGNKNG